MEQQEERAASHRPQPGLGRRQGLAAAARDAAERYTRAVRHPVVVEVEAGAQTGSHRPAPPPTPPPPSRSHAVPDRGAGTSCLAERELDNPGCRARRGSPAACQSAPRCAMAASTACGCRPARRALSPAAGRRWQVSRHRRSRRPADGRSAAYRWRSRRSVGERWAACSGGSTGPGACLLRSPQARQDRRPGQRTPTRGTARLANGCRLCAAVRPR